MSLGLVVGVDGSPPSKAAVTWAARTAELHRTALTLVHVVVPPNMMAWQEPIAMTGYGEWQQTRAREILDEAAQLAQQAAPGIQISTESIAGPSISTLIDLSKDAETIVVGCRGLGAIGRALLGSVSRALVHHAHCPVAVIHDQQVPTDGPVVVGVDGSPVSERAVAVAFDEASRRGVDLIAVHAWSDAGVMDFPGFDFTPLQQDAQEVLAERLAGWQERYPDVRVERVVAFDRPAAQLLLQARGAQLVVVGSHGRGGFAGMLLGSVSSAVVNAATVPVLVARYS
ncbi:universal stress protein [Mycobacterium sp. MS1601]|uniref:universal stress protein n=1 Tax=Mycobacterium sp. MS1601 TaxID=1936029 RepID=UPI0009791780|nr:universal stress protein [Mycobacterium sp. MS1601]AQA04682.1 universal stress protein [Mycobacterium sp. MS1601]